MSVPPRAVQLNEANAFLKEHPEVLYVDLLNAEMNGVVRGKRIERTSLHKVYEKGINLPASLFALDINGSRRTGPDHLRGIRAGVLPDRPGEREWTSTTASLADLR